MTNIHLSQPESHKLETPHGPLWISVNLDGTRWVPIKAISEVVGVSQAEIMKKLDRNNRYWGHQSVLIPEPWKLALPLGRVSEFLHSIKSHQVSRPSALGWLQANVYRVVHDFQIPDPIVPLIPTEPEPVHVVIRTPRPKVKAESEPMAVVSSELIPIQRTNMGGDEVNAVSGRDLHAFLEVGKDFTSWIKDHVETFGFCERRDFEVFTENGENPKGGRPSKEYMISISMAKELAMVQRTAKGKQARLYFIECERRAMAPVAAMSQFRVPTNLREALHLAAELEDKRMELASKVEAQQETIAMLEPKANGLDLIATTAEGAHTLTESAKILQQPPRKFVKYLEREAWVYRTNGNLTAYQPRIHQGLMEHKFVTIHHKDGPTIQVAQPLITPKGLAKLAGMLGGVA